MSLSQLLPGLPRRAFEQVVKLPVRHRQTGAIIEVLEIQAKRAVRLYIHQILADPVHVERAAVGSQTHELVLARVHPESGVVGEGRIKQAERMREMDLAENLQLISTAQRNRSGGPFADAVHGEHQGFIEW